MQKIATQGLTQFHEGQWHQARIIFRQINQLHVGPEVSAAWGICELFARGPTELDDTATTQTEQIMTLLQAGDATGWPEVTASQIWLQLWQSKHTATTAFNQLALLVDCCQESNQPLIWALAFRALAYFDQRQTLPDLLVHAEKRATAHPLWHCVLMEAQLECGQIMIAASPGEAYWPLTKASGGLWQEWLQTENEWWHGGEITAVFPASPTAPPQDIYSLKERQRINHRITLLKVRQNLAQGHFANAQLLVEQAQQIRPGAWENPYLAGLVAWAQGDHQTASSQLTYSLTLNPFQSRVQFEYELLVAQQNNLPLKWENNVHSSHDMIVGVAVDNFRRGKLSTTASELEKLDKITCPFSRRLIDPQTYQQRIRQGWALRGHLAEKNSDWQEARGYWRRARVRNATGYAKNPAERVHELYLLRQVWQHQTEPDKPLHTQFHKELGKLSIRHLLGDALFYRGLAQTDLKKAVQDWRAVLNEASWVAQTQAQAPDRLLYLATQLLKAGFHEEAQHLYEMSGAREHHLITKMIVNQLTNKRVEMEAFQNMQLAESYWWAALYTLADSPHNSAEADVLLAEASQMGLATHWQELGQALSSSITHKTCDHESLSTLLDGLNMPPALRLGVEAIFNPKGIETLQAFQALLGADWQSWCPVAPLALLGYHLYCCYCQQNIEDALHAIAISRTLGMEVPYTWDVIFLVMAAIQSARQEDLEAAQEWHQQAVLSINKGGTSDDF